MIASVDKKISGFRRVVLTGFDLVVLAAAVLLAFIITRDIVSNVSFIVDPEYLRLQFWICVVFMADIVVECVLGRHGWRRLLVEIVFFFLCIPFVNIIVYFHLKVSGELIFVLRLLPMIRASYIIVQVMSAIDTNRVTNLFRAYITLFAVIVYFSSLMFYVEEHPVNHDVDSYWSSLWWTVMTLTTAGCYITEVTTVGKILSVILSGGGLILFPVFTVYVANAVSGGSNSADTSATDSNDADVSDDKKSEQKPSTDGNNANFAKQ